MTMNRRSEDESRAGEDAPRLWLVGLYCGAERAHEVVWAATPTHALTEARHRRRGSDPVTIWHCEFVELMPEGE